jgi:ferritin-like protein
MPRPVAYIAARMSHEGYHEPEEKLSSETKNLHRALVSLQEELEAIDWYQQRADACNDEALKAVLLHNRNEEVEHAMMVLEWIRRNDPKFDEFAREYLFTTADITNIEAETKAGEGGGAPAPAAVGKALGIGSLRGR